MQNVEHEDPKDHPHMRDEVEIEQVAEVARLGEWLQGLYGGAQRAGEALEAHVAAEVQRRLTEALRGSSGTESIRDRLETLVVHAARIVARHTQLRIDGERGLVRIRTQNRALQPQLRLQVLDDLADAGLEREQREPVLEAIERTLRALHGEEFEVPNDLRADLASVRDGLRRAKRQLRRIEASSDDPKPAPQVPGPPTPSIPEPENPPAPHVYPGPTQPPEPPVPPPSSTPRDRK